MVIAKAAKKNPMELAELLAKKLSAGGHVFIEKAEAAAPGFVNLRLADDELAASAARALVQPRAWGTSSAGKGKTTRLDYFQLNIAKRPHVGHLRSAVIGDALKRMFLASGWHTVADTHVGDWGTQFGISLKAYKEARANKEHKDIENIEHGGDPFDALEELYRKENALIEV